MNANINFHNTDSMEAMKDMRDNQYDLAIIDTPYGIGECGDKNKSRTKMAIAKDYKPFHGNDKESPDKESPEKEYFTNLLRISKNQIIWGANHFIEKINRNSSCWIVWEKDNGKNDFADCELAWTSFTTAVRLFKYRWAGMLQENMKNKEIRIHPTQKPVALYKWLLQNYAKEGDKIIDTHGGSMSIAIACWDLKFDLELYEIDEEYYRNGVSRFENHCKQGQFFLS